MEMYRDQRKKKGGKKESRGNIWQEWGPMLDRYVDDCMALRHYIKASMNQPSLPVVTTF